MISFNIANGQSNLTPIWHDNGLQHGVKPAILLVMFDTLSEKILGPIRNLGKAGVIKESHIKDTIKEIRMALLEADVHFKVVKEFMAKVQERAVGEELIKAVSPAQQFVKIVHDALVEFLGGEREGPPIELNAKPPVPLLMVGLQGSGKTTTTAKLGLYFEKKERKKVLVVPADNRRPAAKEQLMVMAEKAGVACFDSDLSTTPPQIAKAAMEFAAKEFFDIVIVDTAGRLAIDDDLMAEIEDVRKTLNPHKTLFVADSMTGQDAVNVAQAFHAKTELSGVILTKLDGDARGGAALSIKYLTQLPILFFGMGEGVKALEPYHADRLANRILDMGDVVSLVEKAQEAISEDEAKASMESMKKGKFTLEDFLKQMKMMKRLGSMESILKMLPGGGQIVDQMKGHDTEKEMKRTEAIILSMTKQERKNHKILNGSRRARIAAGSGTSVQEVNQLIKKFQDAQKMMSRMSKMGMMNKFMK